MYFGGKKLIILRAILKRFGTHWDLGEAMNNKKVEDSLFINDEICSDEVLIANAFNDYFSQIGSKVSFSVPPTNSNYWDFFPHQCSNTFFIDPVVPSDIASTISQLEKKSSEDINGISINFLCTISFQIYVTLVHIFNLKLSLF